DRMDLVRRGAVDAARQAIRRRRYRERGAERGNAADAGHHPRDLEDLSIRDREPIDVADATRVGDEVQTRAITRPVRVDVLRARDTGQLANRARLDADPAKP